MSKTSKIVTKSLAGVLSLAMVVTSLTVTGTTSEAKAKIKSVKVTSPVVNGGKLVLKKGQKKRIKVKVTKSGKISKKVTYKSSNPKVAKIVKSKGKVYVKAVGKKNKTAKITIASKANKKKKATLKIKVGTPIKKVTVSKFKVTTSVTNNKEADATKRTKKTRKTTKFVSTKKSVLTMTAQYDDKAADTTNQQIAQLYVKYSPTKVGYKGMKWKAKNSKIIYVSPYGVVTPVKAGSTKIYGYTKDGTNKKVTINVKINPAPTTATPTPNFEKDSRTATTVEDFESYAEGTKWTRYTAGGYADSGTMTVVKDPENSNNKVLKVDYTGKDQAFDFAPVFNLKLPNGKKLSDYSAIRLKSRVISNSSDCNYKTIAVYFDGKGTIKSSDYFDTSNYDGSTAKGASKQEYRFGVNISMATGVDKNYNVPTSVEAGNGIQDKDIIAISPWKQYNNKVFPGYYSDYASGVDKNAVAPGFSENETSATNKVGFQQNTLELNTDRINEAWITDNDKTPLLNRNELDMVIGSTYTGSKGRSYSDWHVILYLDDIQVMSGEIACTKMEFTNPVKKLACGNPAKGTTGASAQMKVAYTPANTTQKEVTYTSSDASLATVDDKGLVTANSNNKEGVVTITATNKANGSVVAKANITIESVEPATSDYDVLASSTLKFVPKGDVSASNKVASSVSDLTIANGEISMKYTQVDKDIYVLDLGTDINLNRYKGFEITGVAPGQVSLEFYNSDFDMNVTKDNGKDNDWWDPVMVAGKTYPFYVGSCGWRYEGGGMNYLKAWENGYVDPADASNKEASAPSPETLKYSLATLGNGCNGDWSSIRYIVLKANKQPMLQSPYRFKTGIDFIYKITGLKFLANEFMEAKDAGHYIVYNKDAEDTYQKNVAETSGNTTSYYVDHITDTNTVEKHDSTMNLSDMKYIKVKVKDTDKVNVGLIVDGKKLEDTVVVGEETGSGDRSIYVSLKDIEDVDLTKIDAISVEVAEGGSVESVSLTKGEISYAKKDPETKEEVKGSTVTPVTLEAYGSEG